VHLSADYAAELRVRRAQAHAVASTPANRAAEACRPFTASEKTNYDPLSAVITRLDGKIRQAWIETRRDLTGPRPVPDAWDWARANDTSYAALLGSGPRGTLASLRRR
jgi:hypothetical protein